MRFKILGILVMGLLLVACGEDEIVTSVPSAVVVVADTAVSTTTPTSEPTIQPTVTQEPTTAVTETPTMYPTPTPMPTSTPLVPTPNPEQNYELAEWTPERADQLIAELQYLPETLNEYDRGYHYDVYHDTPRYTAFAQLEALSRFPESAMVSNWQWDRAYNLARSNLFRNEPTVEIYTDLLQIVYNNGLANSETIVPWLKNQEPRFEYQVYSLPPPDGYTESFILEMSSEWGSGGYVWVLKTTSAYETYPLNSNWDFGFAHGHDVYLLLEDVTDDDIPDAFIRHFHQPGSIGFLVDASDIFDFSQVPPARIHFHSQPPFLGESAFSSFSVVDDETGNHFVQLDIPAAASYCEARTIQNYQWDGESLVLVDGIYPNLAELFQIEPTPNFPDCAAYAFKQVIVGAEAGDFGALEQLESLIPLWPIREPDTTYRELDQFDNYDTREKLQFLVALLHAFNGNVDNARQHLQAIVASSENPESQWIEPAETFLTVYQDEGDLVAGCIASKACTTFLDNGILINLVSEIVQLEDLPDAIREVGIVTVAERLFDLDQDGSDELLLFLERGVYATPYIFTQMPNGSLQQIPITGLYNFTLPIDLNTFSRVYQGSYGSIYKIEDGDGLSFFYQKRDTNFNLPELGVFDEKVVESMIVELSETHDFQIAEDLIQLMRRWPDYECEEEEEFFPLHYHCKDIFLSKYVTGLAYELVGREKEAVQIYYDLWQNHPNTPFAMMARAKLQEAKN